MATIEFTRFAISPDQTEALVAAHAAMVFLIAESRHLIASRCLLSGFDGSETGAAGGKNQLGFRGRLVSIPLRRGRDNDLDAERGNNSIEPRRHPPVRSAEQLHDRRKQDHPNESGVNEDCRRQSQAEDVEDP